jgi:hypothetical protein
MAEDDAASSAPPEPAGGTDRVERIAGVTDQFVHGVEIAAAAVFAVLSTWASRSSARSAAARSPTRWS